MDSPPRPVQFGHSLEVHAPDTDEDRRRHAYHRYDRQDLEEIVLLDVDESQDGVEQQLDLVGQARFVVA